MTKKRQQDFPKVQLKLGRSLKRSNITSTKFKSRKILMPKEKIVKVKSEYTIEDCIRRIKNTGSEKDKIGHLNELNKLMHRQTDSLNTLLPQIFEVVLDYIRDPYDSVRNAALKAIIYVIENTDDLYLRSYTDLLNNNISAIMKSPNQKVTPASLVLLDCMLKNHPDLICHNINILYDLLPTERKHYTRKITSERETYQYSERGEINAFGHINAFLENMLKIKMDSVKIEEEEEKIAYMDENETMSLVLYTGGGLQPVDIEEAYSKQFNPRLSPFDEAEKLTPLIEELIRLIPGFFCQIISTESNADDNTFRFDPIADLSILIQLLCNVAELAEKICYTDAAEEITAFLKERVFSSHRKRFPFELHTVMPGTSLQHLALLNTSLCFLFMKFLSSTDDCDDDDWNLIEKYLKKLLALEKTYSSEIKCKCIPFFVKMIQLYCAEKKVPDVIELLLKQLVLLLKTRINHPNKKLLINLFYNMSLLPEYKFWMGSEAMDLWYDWLLSHLKENINKLDKKLMRMICKIAKLRHKSFIKNLDFSVIKPLLKHRNDDLKETAIFLLHNMDIDKDLLKNVYDVICLDSFPKKFAVSLIHMVNVKFDQYPASKKPYVDYIEFLLNTAIDTFNFFSTKMVDFEANDYTRAIKFIRDGLTFEIVPSLHWKEHSKLFAVCLMYLRNLPTTPVNVMFMRIVKELLNSRVAIPIHCALAILKLDTPDLTHKHHRILMRDLKFSCLLAISVLSQKMSNDDEWYKWNICELMNNLNLSNRLAVQILEVVHHGHFGKGGDPDALIVYHILRVIKVLIENHHLHYENPNNVELILSVITRLTEEQCSDKNVKHQPFYVTMYNFLIQYL